MPSSPIHATAIGMYRDGGTLAVTLRGNTGEELKIFIDRRIKTSGTELYGAIWINDYPEKAESERIIHGTPEAHDIAHALGEALSNYTKGTRDDWTPHQQVMLQDVYDTLNFEPVATGQRR